jgi:RNA polymerase sigma-70 factor (ECF subfamily)
MLKSDKEIISEFRSGKLDSFYKMVYPGMRMFAIKYLGNENSFLAEDCVQNVIFKSWERRKDFNTLSSLKSFMYTLIKNEAINLFRKQNTHYKYSDLQRDEAFFKDALVEQEVKNHLYNSINELPEKYRKVFELSFVEGLKNVEIAEILGISDSSVKKQKAQALKILKDKLEPVLFTSLFASVVGDIFS